MKIDLSTIEGEPRPFTDEIQIGADRLDPTRVAGPMKVRLEGSVRPVDDRYLVSGRTRCEGLVSCGRCLQPVEWSTSSTFEFEVALIASAPIDAEVVLDEADLDVVYVENMVLDLEDLATEQVLLELPMRVLCSDDCAGLCPSCGADRNVEGACRCEPEPDPRWSALRDLSKDAPVD